MHNSMVISCLSLRLIQSRHTTPCRAEHWKGGKRTPHCLASRVMGNKLYMRGRWLVGGWNHATGQLSAFLCGTAGRGGANSQ